MTARTRMGLARWEQVCRRMGIHYVSGDRDSIVPTEARAIRVWETARAGREVDPADWELTLALSAYDLGDPQSKILPLDLRDLPIWREALTGIPPARRQYYEACLRRSRKAFVEPPQVLITTIHGAKGRQADRSAVLSDLPGPASDSLRRGGTEADAEHRVWYVAATRAKESLTVVAPSSTDAYDLGVYNRCRLGLG